MKITMLENEALVIEILGEPNNTRKQIIWVYGNGEVTKSDRGE